VEHPLVRLLTLRSSIGTQPQGDVRRLHRLPHHPYQIVAQGVEVRLVPELGREDFERLSSVILTAVKAPIDEGLDSPTEGREQDSSSV
jgi:hypothetical protein